MALNEAWHIRSRARTCAVTERPFNDGETIITALFPDPESSGYVRRDFSVEAWENRDEDSEKPFSQWRGKYVPPVDHSEEDPMKKLSADELLARLVEEDEDHTENTRYILAVMLERQRILRETDNQRTADGIIRVYENRKNGDVFIVRDPNLPLDQIEAVQNEVMTLLENNGKIPQTEETPADATDATDGAVPGAPPETVGTVPPKTTTD